LAPNLDIKTYDGGNYWITGDAYGPTPTVKYLVGKLFVEYDVEFFTPQLPPTGDPIVGASGAQTGPGAVLAIPLGTPANAAGNALGNFAVNAASTRNIISMVEDVADGLFFQQTAGTGLTGINAPTLTSFDGSPSQGIISVFTAPILNAAGTLVNATWRLQNIKKADIFTMNGVAGATIANTVVNLARQSAGVL
jgi:hypothetical protein